MRGSSVLICSILSILGLSVSATQSAWAAVPSGLDPDFGTGGTVVTGLGGIDTAYGVAVQPDGRIVGAGYANRNGNDDFALVRYLPSGAPDSSFGTGGTVLTDLSGQGSYDVARALLVQPDGKIVLAGQSTAGAGVALARYTRQGGLDRAFGTAGTVLTGIRGVAYAVALQPDGGIVVAGSADAGGGNDVLVARFRPDGSPDPGFGAGGGTGAVLTDVSGSGSNDTGSAVAIQRDGAILVAGSSDSGAGPRSVLLRYRPDGGLDRSFGAGGIVLSGTSGLPGAGGVAGGRASAADAVAVQPDGRIVTAGNVQEADGTAEVALSRYRPDGSPDASFGAAGMTVTAVGGPGQYATASALVIDGRGRIVAAGSTGSRRSGDFALARYTADGVLDPTFGSGGTAVHDFGGQDDRAFAVALQGDGKIVAAGYADGPLFATFALARYAS